MVELNLKTGRKEEAGRIFILELAHQITNAQIFFKTDFDLNMSDFDNPYYARSIDSLRNEEIMALAEQYPAAENP